MQKKNKNKPTIEELNKFWDGPKVGFNEAQYKKYIDAKNNWIKNMN